MQTPIPKLLLHIREQYQRLIRRVTQNACEECHSVWFHCFDHVHALEAAEFFELGIFGPGAERDL
jgi:hypothetical protein